MDTTASDTRSTQLTPEALYAQFRRGDFQLAVGKPADAALTLAPVVAAVPDNAAVLELYARALLASAQLGRAERTLRTLVDLCPDDGWAQLALARSLERQGRHEEARPHRQVAHALGQTG